MRTNTTMKEDSGMYFIKNSGKWRKTKAKSREAAVAHAKKLGESRPRVGLGWVDSAGIQRVFRLN